MAANEYAVRREVAVRLMEGLRGQSQLVSALPSLSARETASTLIVWGPMDGYMPENAARAYLRDLPDAELHLFDDAGHWLLETHLDAVVPLVRGFLDRVDARRSR